MDPQNRPHPYDAGPYNHGQYNPGPYNQGGYGQPQYGRPPHLPAPFHNGFDAQRMMLYDANKKSAGVAYALWFFLGMFGAHRFYLDRSGTGAAQLVITLMSGVLMIVFIGFFSLIGVGIWVMIDAFLIPDWIRAYNNRLIAGMTY